MCTEADFMKAAIDEACKGVTEGHGGPFGAVVVKDGKIIATGHNQVIKSNDPTCHAEIVSIRNACQSLNTFDLHGCQLYASCYPCPMCLGACLWSRIDRMIYGATPKQAADAGFDDQNFYDFIKGENDKTQMMDIKNVQLSQEELSKPFNMWMTKDNKVPY